MTLAALTEGPLVDALEGTHHSLKLELLAASEFQGHLLRLHRVHAGQSTDRRVKVDRFGRLLARFQVIANFCRELFEFAAEALLLLRVHGFAALGLREA